MRQILETFFAVAAVVGTEAWFLKGYFSGQPDFEPAIAFIAALGFILLKDPLRARFSGSQTTRLHDRELFEEFLRSLPMEPTLRLIKDHNFGDSFSRRAIQPLFEFTATWDNVEKEFLSETLEKERRALLNLANDLASEIARRTVPIGAMDYQSVVSDRMRASDQPRPAHVIEDARILNEKAAVFFPKYEAFVRLCRAKLAH